LTNKPCCSYQLQYHVVDAPTPRANNSSKLSPAAEQQQHHLLFKSVQCNMLSAEILDGMHY
jgi:hypothetical protein